MSEDEKAEHADILEMDTPTLIQHLAREQIGLIERETSNHSFCHWCIQDYTERYKKGDVTPTEVTEFFIKSVEEMYKFKPIITRMDQDVLRLDAAKSIERYAIGK